MPPNDRRTILFELFVRLFREAGDPLRKFLRGLDPALLDHLSKNLSHSEQMYELVALLEKHGYPDDDVQSVLRRSRPRHRSEIDAAFRSMNPALDDPPAWDISDQLTRPTPVLTLGTNGERTTLALCRVPRNERLLWRPVITASDIPLHQASIELRNPSPSLRVRDANFFRDLSSRDKRCTIPVHDLSGERRLTLEEWTDSEIGRRHVTEMWIFSGTIRGDRRRFRLPNNQHIEIAEAKSHGCFVLVNFPKTQTTDTLILFEA